TNDRQREGTATPQRPDRRPVRQLAQEPDPPRRLRTLDHRHHQHRRRTAQTHPRHTPTRHRRHVPRPDPGHPVRSTQRHPPILLAGLHIHLPRLHIPRHATILDRRTSQTGSIDHQRDNRPTHALHHRSTIRLHPPRH